MLKRNELREPNSCLNKAASDEMVFVLRANDPIAAQTVRLWATMADGVHEAEKISTALEAAERMEKWRDVGPVPVPTSAAARTNTKTNPHQR